MLAQEFELLDGFHALGDDDRLEIEGQQYKSADGDAPDLLPRLEVNTAGELPTGRVVLLPGTPAAALPGAVTYGEWLTGQDGQGVLLPADEDA